MGNRAKQCFSLDRGPTTRSKLIGKGGQIKIAIGRRFCERNSALPQEPGYQYSVLMEGKRMLVQVCFMKPAYVDKTYECYLDWADTACVFHFLPPYFSACKKAERTFPHTIFYSDFGRLISPAYVPSHTIPISETLPIS